MDLPVREYKMFILKVNDLSYSPRYTLFYILFCVLFSSPYLHTYLAFRESKEIISCLKKQKHGTIESPVPGYSMTDTYYLIKCVELCELGLTSSSSELKKEKK